MVRLIESLRSEQLEIGFAIGHGNQREVTSRLLREGGAQERELVCCLRNNIPHACGFHDHPDHPLCQHPDTDSTLIRTLIPRTSGHFQAGSNAGLFNTIGLFSRSEEVVVERISNRTEGRIDAQTCNEIDGNRGFRLTIRTCVTALRLPGRMTVEQVAGCWWTGWPNGVESAL